MTARMKARSSSRSRLASPSAAAVRICPPRSSHVGEASSSSNDPTSWFSSRSVSVAVSDDVAVVGAYFDDDNGLRSGSAYVFAKDQGGVDNWGEVTKLLPSDGAPLQNLGWSVAISGDLAIVSGVSDDGDDLTSGSAYVFARDRSGADIWVEIKKLRRLDTVPSTTFFGWSVAISGGVALVTDRPDAPAGLASASARPCEY